MGEIQPLYTNAPEGLVCRAFVSSVSPERWTVDVQCELPHGGPIYDIPIMSPYYSAGDGHGMFQIPEPGAPCVIMFMEGGADPVVLGFLPIPDFDVSNNDVESNPLNDNLNKPLAARTAAAVAQAGNRSSGGFGTDARTGDENPPGKQSYRMNREGSMLPGDGILKTSFGNKIRWYSNGTILVQSTNLCMDIWQELGNKRTSIAVNTEMTMPGLFHNRTTDQEEETTLDDYGVKSSLRDTRFSLLERKGTFTANKSTIDSSGAESEAEADAIYELFVQDVTTPSGGGSSTADAKTRINVFKDGSVQVKAADDVPITVVGGGDVNLRARNVNIFTDQEAKIVTQQNATIESQQNVELKAAQNVVVEALQTLLGDAAASEPAVLGLAMTTLVNSMITFMTTHTHQGVHGPTSVPLEPFAQTMGPAEVSTKVKVAT